VINKIKPNIYASICPSREVLSLIGEKWVSLIVGALNGHTLRFGGLKTVCEGVSQKMLTQTLRKLERAGMITRTVYPDALPLKVEYALTPLGTSLVPVLSLMKQWAQDNLHRVEHHRRVYDDAHPLKKTD